MEMYAASLLDIFFQLSTARPQAFQGIAGITWTEMKAWCDLNEVVLTPFEIQLLKLLDITYVNASQQQ